MKTSPVIFTDMDGSLLDHYTYSFKAAEELLLSLYAQNIPVIPNTSKTFAELEVLRASLNNTEPFIVENGAAVFIPKGYFPAMPNECIMSDDFWVYSFCTPRSHWISLISELKEDFAGEFKAFNELEVEEITELTGLNLETATLASQRMYGEPVNWLGDSERRLHFIQRLQQKGAQVLEGGRFIHVSGECNKGTALSWLMSQYRNHYPEKSLTSIAVGDGKNDIAMLNEASIALLIRSPVHTWPQVNRSHNTYKTEQYGPKGWAEGITKILKLLNH